MGRVSAVVIAAAGLALLPASAAGAGFSLGVDASEVTSSSAVLWAHEGWLPGNGKFSPAFATPDPSNVQGLPSLHTSGMPPQRPSRHEPPVVHGLPSLHRVPFALKTFLHVRSRRHGGWRRRRAAIGREGVAKQRSTVGQPFERVAERVIQPDSVDPFHGPRRHLADP